MWYKAYSKSTSVILKERYPRKTTITWFEPAPIQKKKTGGVCYYIASINRAMLLKIVVQLNKCLRSVTYPPYFFEPPFKINMCKVRYWSLLKYIHKFKEPFKIHNIVREVNESLTKMYFFANGEEKNIVPSPQRHRSGNEYWAVGVCFPTPWDWGEVGKREKVSALHMGKAVGWGRRLKMGILGSCELFC